MRKKHESWSAVSVAATKISSFFSVAAKKRTEMLNIYKNVHLVADANRQTEIYKQSIRMITSRLIHGMEMSFGQLFVTRVDRHPSLLTRPDPILSDQKIITQSYLSIMKACWYNNCDYS